MPMGPSLGREGNRASTHRLRAIPAIIADENRFSSRSKPVETKRVICLYLFTYLMLSGGQKVP